MKQIFQQFPFFILVFFLFFSASLFSQENKRQTAPFTLNGKIVLAGKPIDNVSIELLKNGQSLRKILTTKNGKYSFVMDQDTLNQKNEYTIHISKAGTVPKTLIVNTYIPKEQYDDNTYEYILEITLIPTTMNEVVVQRPSAKIKWNESENSFGLDQVYAKIIQKEEEKLKSDPDKYLREIAEKLKKEREEKAAAEEAKRKKDAEEEKQKAEDIVSKESADMDLARQKENEKAEILVRKNLKAIKTELLEQPKVNSTAENSGKEQLSTISISSKNDKEEEVSDVSVMLENTIKKDKKALEVMKEKAAKKKNANIATKYETNNALSSLLDAVDEHDKRLKYK